MSVDFISSTPHRAVYWSKNDVIIQQDDKHTFTVTPAKVSVESDPGVNVDGFTASLLIDGTESRDAGMYKMVVANEHGISERTLYVKRGHSVTMLPHYEAFPRNATITVTFSSDPDFKIEWYKKQRFLTPGSDVRVTTELVGEGEDGNAIYRSVLYPESPKQIHYGDYKFIIRKDIGTVETHILMDFPETELPKLLATPTPVEMRNRSLILTVDFDSNIAYPTVSWYHGDVPLRTSDRYRLELRWKGISSDWVAQGYPSVLPSTPFKLVTSSNSSYSYMYPSIGGNRSLTQLNANYTAVLTISDVKPADFGLYRVILENDAGATHHVIEVTAPEVFPYVTCDQADTIQLACNVTSCSRVTLSWIHSVDDDVVRNLPGHQDGSINTLTIPMCMHSDAGMYTCVAEEGTGSDVTIIHDTTTVTVRAVPVILESTVNISGDRLHIELPFYSYPPHHRVTWHRNGGQISPSDRITIGIEQHDVNLPMHGKTCRQVGHVTSVEVPAPVDEDFGTYKITISNKIGTSEHIIEVQNPKYINPVASSDVNVSYDGGSAVLRVTFTTYYPEFNVKWYFKGEEIRENHPVNKYKIQTDNSTHSLSPIQAVPNSFGVPVTVVRRKLWKSSVLTVTCVSEKDYGKYDVLVSNKAGKAVIPVKLTKHGQGVPAMVGDIVTTAINSTREISAKFHSVPRYRLIKWFKDDKEITNDTSKYVIVNEDVDIEIPSSEESMKETGTITRLRVTSPEEEDYGLYRVQIYNDVGMIDGSATLDEDCK
ncbi:titin-like [Pecten maximus]|uniref:titin-like n=1 Tax=Pecten maximus TaxID=6579 RepID=UPI0014590C88|nr:titin-like [Pecten maximus]